MNLAEIAKKEYDALKEKDAQQKRNEEIRREATVRNTNHVFNVFCEMASAFECDIKKNEPILDGFNFGVVTITDKRDRTFQIIYDESASIGGNYRVRTDIPGLSVYMDEKRVAGLFGRWMARK